MIDSSFFHIYKHWCLLKFFYPVLISLKLPFFFLTVNLMLTCHDQSISIILFLLLQLADAKDVMEAVRTIEGVRLPVLTPNLKVNYAHSDALYNFCSIIIYCTFVLFSILLFAAVTTHQGFEAAIAAGAKEIAIFASASEGFSKSNINCTIKESIARYNDVALAAKENEIPVRG